MCSSSDAGFTVRPSAPTWKGNARCRPSGSIDPHTPDAFGCVLVMMATPCGMPSALLHRPMLVWMSAGAPLGPPLVVPADHWMVTHGWYFGPTVNGQPAMMLVSETSKIGAPPAVTFVFAKTKLACPPCGHM